MLPAGISKAERFASEGGFITINKNAQDYYTFSSPINSYLYVNKDNTITRVEYYQNEIVYENYDKNFKLISSGKIKKELELFGGFFAGENANFIVFGQTNKKESKNKEVLRIVKYSKDFKRISSVSIKDCNTTIPFHAGSLRFAEAGNMLYIRSSHEMYKTPDRINHQASMAVTVNTSTMKITYSVLGYVSHSFNQFVKVNGSELLAVDHGDGYPRAVVLMKYEKPAGEIDNEDDYTDMVESVKLLEFPGMAGDNYTGASVGGFEASATSYLVAGNYANTGSEDVRNIFLSITANGQLSKKNTKLVYLTDYDKDSTVTTSTPQLVKINDNRFMILWEAIGRGYNVELHYIIVDGEGKKLTKVKKVRAFLSDCQPIVYNDKVTWYYTNETSPIFCTLPTDGSDPVNKMAKDDKVTVNNIIYTVTESSSKSKTLTVYDFINKKVSSITIPDTVKVNGETFQVTEIDAAVFEQCYNLKTVVLGSNLTNISNLCMPSNVKKIVLKSTKVKSFDKEAFKNVSKSAVMQVPKSKLSTYKKLIKGNFKIEAIK